MKKAWLYMIMPMILMASPGAAQDPFETDTITTSAGELKITFIGHGSLMFTFGDLVVHVDPFGRLTDYTALPKADLILVTHEHYDHLDLQALKALAKEGTQVVINPGCAQQVADGISMQNGDVRTVKGLRIEAVAAYNLVHRRPSGEPFHPQGVGNGYVIAFGDKRIYVAGDTENIPEMKQLKQIAVAFLPMNLPYTMTPEMVADAARAFKPAILYPYHFGETDTSRLIELMRPFSQIEVRIRKMK